MKILHLANFYHAQSGGIKTYLDKKRDYFEANGLPFRLIIPDEIDSVEKLENDVIIYRIGASSAPYNPLYRIIWNLVGVHQVINHEQPDLLEVNDKYTLAGLSLFYRKVTKSYLTAGFHHERLDNNMLLYLQESDLIRKLAYWGMNIVSACFDKIICASRYTAEEIEPIAPDKVEIINLGTDTTKFHPGLASREIHDRYARGADKLLVYAGRLAREKNIEMLPDIMDNLRDRGIKAHLIIAGVGPDAETIKRWDRDDTTLLGFIGSRREIAGLFSSCDAMVFPSLREPYGLVPLEGLASGLPVVCANQGGVVEYAASEAVRSVPPTAEHFGEALAEILSLDRDKIGRAAREHSEKFTWDQTFSKQLRVYEELISSRVEQKPLR